MLEDYIKEYKEALKNKDVKNQKRIEKELSILGMDKYTLMILVNEV